MSEATGMKKTMYLKFDFLPPEPESSPQNVEVTDVTASEISLKWSPPEKPNGIIVAYEVLYKNIDTLFMKNTSTTSISLRDLKPYTLYNISVRSYTRFGHGNQLSSLVSVRTSETGKCFVCLFNNWAWLGSVVVKFVGSASAAQSLWVWIPSTDLHTTHQAVLWQHPTYKMEEDWHRC